MIRFALVLLMSLAVSLQAVAAVKFNSGNSDGYKVVSPKAKLIGKNFEFVSVGLVAIDLSKRMSSVSQGILQQRCIYSTNVPNVINDVNAPPDYGLDDRFNATAGFFRGAAANCLGGKIQLCEQIHQHALDYAKNSKLSKPREYPHKINDTMTVNMRLIGPMAMALGISWNIVEPNEVEKGLIIDWLKGIEPTFDTPLRTKRPYTKHEDGFAANPAAHNHTVQSSIASMSVGALIGDEEKFMKGIDQWFVTLDSMRPDGSLPIETSRGARAMFYHGRVLSALFAIALRSEVQGVDLFSIEREKSIHKAVKFYLDVAREPNLVTKYAKVNKAPGPSNDYTRQDVSKVGGFDGAGHGWVKIYMERFPNHPNTKTLESLSKSSNPIAAKLSVSVSQMGKSSEWITVDTRCFYNSVVEAEQKANYDRTRTGMEKRFSCLRSHVESNGFKNFPSNQEIDAFIQNVEKLTFTSDTSVTTGTDTKKISPFQILRLGLPKLSMADHKKAIVKLVNFEGTNEEYCARLLP